MHVNGNSSHGHSVLGFGPIIWFLDMFGYLEILVRFWFYFFGFRFDSGIKIRNILLFKIILYPNGSGSD